MVSRLGEGFKGEAIGPADPGYDDARAVWSGSIDKRPGLIVRPTGAADVIDAVTYARAKGLPLAVRCGGHSMAGNDSVEGGGAGRSLQPEGDPDNLFRVNHNIKPSRDMRMPTPA